MCSSYCCVCDSSDESGLLSELLLFLFTLCESSEKIDECSHFDIQHNLGQEVLFEFLW